MPHLKAIFLLSISVMLVRHSQSGVSIPHEFAAGDDEMRWSEGSLGLAGASPLMEISFNALGAGNTPQR